MKLFFGCFMGILMTFNVVHGASEYKYECKSIDDNAPYGIEKIQLSFKKNGDLVLHLVDLQVKEKYQKDEAYTPSSESMKKYDRFIIVSAHNDTYAEGPVTPFYVEKVLSQGGKKLKIGKKGGLIKTAGHGYSWATYLCYR